MNYNNLHIGRNIEFLISIRNKKKIDVADMLGITRQQLRIIEKSEDVSTSMLKKIAFILNIDIKDFVMEIETLEVKYNSKEDDKTGVKGENTRDSEILNIQIQACRNENSLMKELLNAKDDLIKLLITTK